MAIDVGGIGVGLAVGDVESARGIEGHLEGAIQGGSGADAVPRERGHRPIGRIHLIDGVGPDVGYEDDSLRVDGDSLRVRESAGDHRARAGGRIDVIQGAVAAIDHDEVARRDRARGCDPRQSQHHSHGRRERNTPLHANLLFEQELQSTVNPLFIKSKCQLRLGKIPTRAMT